MSNKSVLITGATGDFGKAFAKRFAQAGYSLILHGRNAEKLEQLCKSFSTPCHGIVFDATDKVAMRHAISNLPDNFKNIAVLINNAGLALGLEKAQESNPDDWENMIDVDCKALTLITREILPGMVERKAGHIINIGSTAGNYPYPGANVYIRVTNIEPGQVETQFSTVRFKGDLEKAKSVYAGTNSLQADDVAEAVFWAATLPAHVNINRLEMMPTGQSFAGLCVERKTNG
jgi:3-hydroxy acid dehydrogenase/malonic semialdehyde reductase